jgi:hypothetical protein
MALACCAANGCTVGKYTGLGHITFGEGMLITVVVSIAVAILFRPMTSDEQLNEEEKRRGDY